MRIVCISDTHALHRELEVPDGELLIHAGDFTHLSLRSSMLRSFDDWLGGLRHPFKVVVPGNHDNFLEDPRKRDLITNASLLIDSGTEIAGVRIWGSPVSPLPSMAFAMPNAPDRKRHWAQIPEDIDILITHTPPFGVLDQEIGTDEHQGCPELRDAVLRVRPRLHVFGHIHGGCGTLPTKHTMFVNAALYEDGELRRPIVLDFKARTARNR